MAFSNKRTDLTQAHLVVTPSPLLLRDEPPHAVHVLVRQKRLEHHPYEEVRDVEAEHDDPREKVPEGLQLHRNIVLFFVIWSE